MKILVMHLEATDEPGAYTQRGETHVEAASVAAISDAVVAVAQHHGSGRYVARIDGDQRVVQQDSVVEFKDGEPMYAMTTEWLEADVEEDEPVAR